MNRNLSAKWLIAFIGKVDATLLTFLRVAYFFYCTKPWRLQEKRLEKLEGSCKAKNVLASEYSRLSSPLETFRRSHIWSLKTDALKY